jgi:hypothetical protein
VAVVHCLKGDAAVIAVEVAVLHEVLDRVDDLIGALVRAVPVHDGSCVADAVLLHTFFRTLACSNRASSIAVSVSLGWCFCGAAEEVASNAAGWGGWGGILLMNVWVCGCVVWWFGFGEFAVVFSWWKRVWRKGRCLWWFGLGWLGWDEVWRGEGKLEPTRDNAFAGRKTRWAFSGTR